MRAISVVLVVLLLSACAGTPSSRDTGPPGAGPGACGRSGGVAVEPGTPESVQATDGGVAVAIALVWLLLGLASAITGCPEEAAGADATSG
jgi:hypothetical protein